MSKGYVSIKNLTNNLIERKSSIFNTERYNLWKLSKNWEKIFDEIISANCEPKYLHNGKLFINVKESNIYQALIVSQEAIILKINNFLEKKVVYNLEIKKINRELDRYKKEEIIEKKIENFLEKKEEDVERKTKEFSEIKLSEEKMKKIEESISKIIYPEIAEKMKKIAINSAKKDIFLLGEGYKMCKTCGKIFLPNNNEQKCFSCYEDEEIIKQRKMKELIERNPYIGETEAINLTKTDTYIYYKVRDFLAQSVFSELLCLCEKANIEIEENSDYREEIKNENKRDVEILISMYIDFKIGTKDTNIYKKERNKVLRKIKNEMNFRKNRGKIK